MLIKLMSGILLIIGLSCVAGVDGRYLRDLTMNYETPHLEWASKLNGGKLKTLFILARKGGREAVEATQRMDIELNVVTTYNANLLAAEDRFENAIEGTTPQEKTKELLTKLDQKYDLIVIGNFSFDLLPPEAQLKLLKQVMSGSGLVIVYPYETKFKKLFAKPISAGAEEIMALAEKKSLAQQLSSLNDLVKTYEFGKGRIAVLDYKANHSAYYEGLSLTVPNPYSNRWQAEYESNMVLLLRAMKWVAQRDAQITISCPTLQSNAKLPQKEQEVMIELKNKNEFDGQLVLRLRDEFNNIINTQEIPCKFSGTEIKNFSIPFLAGGKYYLDIIAKSQENVDNFGYFSFMIDAPVKLEISAPEIVRNCGAIKAELKLNNVPSNPVEIEVSLQDSPYGRIWYRKSYNLEQQNQISVEISNYYMPTIAGYLKCTVKQQDKMLSVTEKLLFFPNSKLDDYIEMAFGGVVPGDYIAPIYAHQIVDGLGWRYGLTHPLPGGGNARYAALLNQHFVPYTTRIGLDAGKKGEVVQYSWFFMPTQSGQKALNGDESFAAPAVKKLWQDGIKFRVENLSKYGSTIYTLGDENYFSYDAGFGKSDENAFKDFLKQKYGLIAILNQEYGTNYKSFDEVKHMQLQESKAQKMFPAWFDHRQYMEKMYADMHHFLAEEIKKYDQDAKVGAEGSVAGDLEQTIKGLEFWGPYSDVVMDEVLRSIGGNKIRMLWWGGYIGTYGGRGQYPWSLWKDLLTGNVNGNAWYSGAVACGEGALGADMDYPNYLKEMIPYMLKLQNGIAQLLINTPLEKNGIAILWSHASDSAKQLDPRCINPLDSAGTFIKFCYANGLNFDFLTESMLGNLKDYKVFFLFGASSINKSAQEAILEYVKNGGTVIADINPGILNGYLRPVDKNQLEELFGKITYSGMKEPVLSKLVLKQKFSDKQLVLEAENVSMIPGVKTFQEISYGKGRAILFNFSLATAGNSCSKTAPLDKFLLDLLAGVEVAPVVRIEGINNSNTLIRVRQKHDFRLIGLLADKSDIGKTVNIILPEKAYIYEPAEGFIQHDKCAKLKIDRPFKLISCFSEKQEKPEIILTDGKAVPGKPVILSLKNFSTGMVLLLEIKDPAGKLMSLRKQVVIVGKQSNVQVWFAFNDLPGNYTLILTNINSGLKSEKSIML